MYGVWESDPRGEDPQAAGIDIPMQGLGLFACRRGAWPGFDPGSAGLAVKKATSTRRRASAADERCVCRSCDGSTGSSGPSVHLIVTRWEDRIHNYYVGFTELGLDTAEMEAHFAELLGAETCARILAEIKAAYPAAKPREPRRGACDPCATPENPAGARIRPTRRGSAG